MKHRNFQTAEAVLSGHPDKICDQIADGVLDWCLHSDNYSRVACEVLGCGKTVVVGGEYCSEVVLTQENIEQIVSANLQWLGHTHTSEVINRLHAQDYNLRKNAEQHLATDQGIVVGFACTEQPNMMPLPISIAHDLARLIGVYGKPALGPDGKVQVTVEYDGFIPKRIDTVVCSIQHEHGKKGEAVQRVVSKVASVLADRYSSFYSSNTKLLINPEAGCFTAGGFACDSGVTGRKIVCDSYGPQVRIGGGAFSGKDCTKLDRSGAYFARWVAKQIVWEKIASRVEVEVAYCIGKEYPVAINAHCFGTGSDDTATDLAKRFDFRPEAIIEKFNLRGLKYSQFSQHGHFGSNSAPWEQLQ